MIRMIAPTGLLRIGNKVRVKSGSWRGAIGIIREAPINRPGYVRLGDVTNVEGESISETIEVGRNSVEDVEEPKDALKDFKPFRDTSNDGGFVQ